MKETQVPSTKHNIPLQLPQQDIHSTPSTLSIFMKKFKNLTFRIKFTKKLNKDLNPEIHYTRVKKLIINKMSSETISMRSLLDWSSKAISNNELINNLSIKNWIFGIVLGNLLTNKKIKFFKDSNMTSRQIKKKSFQFYKKQKRS